MTSEVAVMNRLAVALAADSAVSVSAGTRNKIYNSANKLFMLSQTHPVGIMVYSNGSLMGVPWEVLIKTFRQQLGNEELPTLEGYGEKLIEYIQSKTTLFTAENSRRSFLRLVESEFGELARRIRKDVAQAEAEVGDRDDWPGQRAVIVAQLIRECHEEWAKREQHPDIPAGTGLSMRSDCSGALSDLVTRIFRTRAWTVASEDTQLINELAEYFIDKDYIAQSSFSGVVIAGFGKNDFFPVLQRYRVGDFYAGRLKVIGLEPVRITEEKPVHVGVYADSDMAGLFLQGISTPALDFVIEKIFEHGVEIVEAALAESGVPVTPELRDTIARRRDDILLKMVDELETYRAEPGDLEMSLVHIPKDELASVAASLVNLNSFKKRISMNIETVGGPVDVAVISKGDGFIWIDRKHYFDADKNPLFVRR
jgi:hypothetical protein